jgi:antitoxin (DNA-binding transcriptional repressor) of toxin-antitoxin stability system
MSRARTVNSSTFKAQCLALMKDVKAGRIDEIIVTRRGRPSVRVTAVESGGAEATYGFMKGSVRIDPGIDLIQPIVDMPDGWPPAPSPASRG